MPSTARPAPASRRWRGGWPPAGRPLPRHRRDVPGGHRRGAAGRRRPRPTRSRSRRRVAAPSIEISHRPGDAGGRAWTATGVDAEIRSAATTAAVSAVSAVPAVRAQLVAAQRELIGDGGDRRRGPRHRLGGLAARRVPRSTSPRAPRRGPGAGPASWATPTSAAVAADIAPARPARQQPGRQPADARPTTRSSSTPPNSSIDEVVDRLVELARSVTVDG